jgi:hypothetical protein
VPGFMPVWTWPHENGEHEAVNSFGSTPSIFHQLNSQISATQILLKESLGGIYQFPLIARFRLGGSPIAPHPSMVTHFVAGKIRNLFPLFLIWIKLVVTHGKNLLQRFLLWGEPLSLLAQGCGSFSLYIIPDLMQLQNDTGPLAPVAWGGSPA